MRLRPRPRLRARAKDRSMDRELLSLRCDPEQYSTLLWPPGMCNHSCIRRELAYYTACYSCCPLNCLLQLALATVAPSHVLASSFAGAASLRARPLEVVSDIPRCEGQEIWQRNTRTEGGKTTATWEGGRLVRGFHDTRSRCEAPARWNTRNSAPEGKPASVACSRQNGVLGMFT